MASDRARAAPVENPGNGHETSGPVAILLCTYNGARFLAAQLASYETLDFADWRLFASDDGSQDATLSLLEDFQKKHGVDKVHIRQGPRRGFVANFLSLICDPAVQGAAYAFSDQDDIWLPDKLDRARRFLMNARTDQPVVYCSRTRLIDESGAEIGLSPLFKKPPSFRNALTQSIAGGNTMVLNEAARQLLMRAGAAVSCASHDWWVYLAVTAVDGTLFYDPEPSIRYRVHARNVIGSNRSLAAQLLRARMLWHGRFKSWADMNVAALERIEGEMTDENRKIFALFRSSRTQSLVPRVRGLMRSGIHRQTLLGNLGLAAAALVGKI
jgi:glycosyltransferase involved in cell wall biosynthesis